MCPLHHSLDSQVFSILSHTLHSCFCSQNSQPLLYLLLLHLHLLLWFPIDRDTQSVSRHTDKHKVCCCYCFSLIFLSERQRQRQRGVVLEWVLLLVCVCVCVFFLLGWVSGWWGVDHHHHHHLRSFILCFDIVSVCQARKLFFFSRNLSFLGCVVFSFCPFCWFFWSEEESSLLGGRKGVLGV